MKQSGFKVENGYNPESNTTVLRKHIRDPKTMRILPSKPTLNDTRNHSVESKHKMLHKLMLNTSPYSLKNIMLG
jgi:hypothetical protein